MALAQSALPETATPLDFRTATTKAILAWRDRIVAHGMAHMDGGNVAEAVRALSSLELATTDEKMLRLTDPFLQRSAAGRKLVAAFEPGRQPRHDEVVFVYGERPINRLSYFLVDGRQDPYTCPDFAPIEKVFHGSDRFGHRPGL